MSKTPRTDAAFAEWWLKEAPYEDLVKVARQLEAENAELREALKNVTQQPPRVANFAKARALLARIDQ